MNSRSDAKTYRCTFKRHVSMDGAQDCLTLAICAAEGLHGRARLRRDGSWHLDRQRRTCTIDASSPVGQDLAKLFTGFLSREFGEGAFQVRRGGHGTT